MNDADTLAKLKEMAVTKHVLKCWPEFFQPVFDGKKNFELRKNDRDYKVGDVLVLREWEPREDDTHGYTGRECTRIIKYKLDNLTQFTPVRGLAKDYCILGLDAGGA
jgi:hypothetical protein